MPRCEYKYNYGAPEVGYHYKVLATEEEPPRAPPAEFAPHHVITPAPTLASPSTGAMSRKFWTLPIRALIEPSARTSATTCRRCLSSQPKSVTAPDIPISPAPRTLKDPEEADNYDPTLPSALRDYRLKSTDFYLKKKLPQAIPPQYLQHSTSEILCPAERAQRDHDRSLQRDIRGVVVSAGKMDKTVRVRVPGRKWNKKIGKVRPPPFAIPPCGSPPPPP